MHTVLLVKTLLNLLIYIVKMEAKKVLGIIWE